MGGAMGLASTSSVLNNYGKHHLSEFLTPAELSTLLQASERVGTLRQEIQDMVRRVFNHGYNLQMKIVIGCSAGQLLGIAVVWKKKNVTVA
jgi:hypothetical protein